LKNIKKYISLGEANCDRDSNVKICGQLGLEGQKVENSGLARNVVWGLQFGIFCSQSPSKTRPAVDFINSLRTRF